MNKIKNIMMKLDEIEVVFWYFVQSSFSIPIMADKLHEQDLKNKKIYIFPNRNWTTIKMKNKLNIQKIWSRENTRKDVDFF